MRNVSWKSGGEEYKGGFVKSQLDYGTWYWLFYEPQQLNRSWLKGSSLKENAETTKALSVDRIIDSKRDGKLVNIAYNRYGVPEPEQYRMVFASEQDAQIFNGEVDVIY